MIRTLLLIGVFTLSLAAIAQAQQAPAPADSQSVPVAQPAAAPVAEGFSLNPYPAKQSNFAEMVDFAFNFIHGVTVIMFVGIIVFMVYFAIRFRRRDPHQKALSQKSHNTALELSWTLPPLVICMYMFYLGFTGFITMATPPKSAYTIEVAASMWNWSVKYNNGRMESNVLHVPAGEPVVIKLTSSDVLHSFFVPAFRVKKDAVPRRNTFVWFEALDPTPDAYDDLADKTSSEEEKKKRIEKALAGAHRMFCAEYCGKNHSNMLAKVIVHPKGWRPAEKDLSKLTPPERGFEYFKMLGCVGCHQLDPKGAKLVGPNFVGVMFGKQEKLTDGSTATIDEAYITESIRKPSAKIVDKHAVGQMPPQDHVTDAQIKDIIEFIKTIK